MTIALYHGFTEIHFEMLGYFIEYIKLNNINIDIYAISSNNTGSQWYKYYETLFSVTSVWKDPQDFNPTLYDLIILLTDDDNDVSFAAAAAASSTSSSKCLYCSSNSLSR